MSDATATYHCFDPTCNCDRCRLTRLQQQADKWELLCWRLASRARELRKAAGLLCQFSDSPAVTRRVKMICRFIDPILAEIADQEDDYAHHE